MLAAKSLQRAGALGCVARPAGPGAARGAGFSAAAQLQQGQRQRRGFRDAPAASSSAPCQRPASAPRHGRAHARVACRGFVRDSTAYYARQAWEAVDGPGKAGTLGETLSQLRALLQTLEGSLEAQVRESAAAADLNLDLDLGPGLEGLGGKLDVDVADVIEKGQGLLSVGERVLSSAGALPLGETAAVAALVAAGIKIAQSVGGSASASAGGGARAGPGDELPPYYDPAAAERYFSKRKALVLKRVFEIVSGSAEFLLSLRTEGVGAEEVSPEVRRKQAVQLRELLSFLGPTFVKAGQALSIRVDLLPEVYLVELRKLQDAVPPFPTDQAYEILDRELASKGGVSGVFESISPQPVASASLGQVYRGKLKDTGREVAIKVQRPDILPSIALDMHILRIIAPILQKYKNLNSDLVGLLDQWGERFVAELDYKREAENGKEFMAAMRARKITSVTSATPVDDLCTSRILVTDWIYGERLELSEAGDVAKLCGLALTAYLTMLLDTGVLHADPHPGNLLRTDEGQLCILDWGLTTEITTDKQYAIIDYIAHLVAEDYVGIPRDLVALGFIPRGKENAVDDQGVVRALSKVFRNLAAGGGAKGINVADVAAEVQFIQSKYGNIFQIPPYFAYILRSFSVLEGIGLQNDPKYAIVQECYPYIARRLFSDNTPRVREALKAIMYEPSASVEGQMKLNVRRFQKLAKAFRTYNEQSVSLLPKQGSESSEADSETQALILKEGLELVFSVEGNYLQEILVREAARTLDTVSRQAVFQSLEAVTGGRGAQLAFPQAVRGVVGRSEDDEVVLETLMEVLSAVQEAEVGPSLASGLGAKSVQEMLPALDEVGPGLLATALRFNAALFERVSGRVLGDN